MILGPVCTRNCRFCDISPGTPAPVDAGEPDRIAQMVEQLKLKHVVVTSVTRDDLSDGGAEQFALVVRKIKAAVSEATVEVLTPDFKGKAGAVDTVLKSCPDIFNHNVETVPRLYAEVRPGADYVCSLKVLRHVTETSSIPAKSGIMVGMGETLEELEVVFRDLADSGVSILTIGQYLAPSKAHFPIDRYVPPDEFGTMQHLAEGAGIRHVFAAPLVRSSYMADMFRSR